MNTPDPRPSIQTDLENYRKLARELLPETGTVVRVLDEARSALQASYGRNPLRAVQVAGFKIVEAFWCVVGAYEQVLHGYTIAIEADDGETNRWAALKARIGDDAELAAVLKPWAILRETAGTMLHNVDRLSEDLRAYLHGMGLAERDG